MRSIGVLNYNIPTLKRLAKININELLFQIRAELGKGLYKTLSSDGMILPNTIYFEPWSYCPNRCKECYVPLEDRKNNIQLSETVIQEITDFARKKKISYILMLWGDPFDDVVFDKTYGIINDFLKVD